MALDEATKAGDAMLAVRSLQKQLQEIERGLRDGVVEQVRVLTIRSNKAHDERVELKELLAQERAARLAAEAALAATLKEMAEARVVEQARPVDLKAWVTAQLDSRIEVEGRLRTAREDRFREELELQRMQLEQSEAARAALESDWRQRLQGKEERALVNAIGGSSVRVAGVSSLPAAHNPSEALIEPGTEDKPKTRKQIRRTVRNRKHRANRKEKKARVKLELATGAGEVPVLDSPHPASPIVIPPLEPPVVLSRNRRRKLRRASEREKKTQDAVHKKAAEISVLAQDSKKQEPTTPLPKESTSQASGTAGRGFKVNPASNVGCVATLLESLAVLVGSVQAGTWTNGPHGQGKGAGHWKPWKKRGEKT